MTTIDLRLTAVPTVEAGMGIHRPPQEVFAAFTDPATTTRFWIADSSGPLAPDARVTWVFDAHGAEATVTVRHFEPGTRLVFDWGDDEHTNTVELSFTPWQGDGCHVTVTETGLAGDGDALAAYAADSTAGFTMVLCSLKALLEHGIELRAVTDRIPDPVT